MLNSRFAAAPLVLARDLGAPTGQQRAVDYRGAHGQALWAHRCCCLAATAGRVPPASRCGVAAPFLRLGQLHPKVLLGISFQASSRPPVREFALRPVADVGLSRHHGADGLARRRRRLAQAFAAIAHAVGDLAHPDRGGGLALFAFGPDGSGTWLTRRAGPQWCRLPAFRQMDTNLVVFGSLEVARLRRGFQRGLREREECRHEVALLAETGDAWHATGLFVDVVGSTTDTAPASSSSKQTGSSSSSTAEL